MKPNQKIVIYMNDGVDCGETTSIAKAYMMLQDLKRADKEMGCKGIIYYFELQEETDDAVYTECVKIYRRGNKVFMRPAEYPF